MKRILILLPAGLILAACKPAARPESNTAPATPPAKQASDPMEPASYVGLTEKEGADRADKAGVKWRIIEVDGKPRPVTMDHRPDRLNFALKDGKIIRVTQG